MFEKGYAELSGGGWKPCEHEVFSPFCSECLRKRREDAGRKPVLRCVHGLRSDETCVLCGESYLQRIINTAMGPGLARQCINNEYLADWATRRMKPPRETSFVNEPALKDADMTVAAAAPEEPNDWKTKELIRLEEVSTEAARVVIRLLKEDTAGWSFKAATRNSKAEAKYHPLELVLQINKARTDQIMSGDSIAVCSPIHNLGLAYASIDVLDELMETLREKIMQRHYTELADATQQTLTEMQKCTEKQAVPYRTTAGPALFAKGVGGKPFQGNGTAGVGTGQMFGTTQGRDLGFFSLDHVHPTKLDVVTTGSGGRLVEGTTYQFFPEGSPDPKTDGFTFFAAHYLMDHDRNFIKIEVDEAPPKGGFTPRKKKVSWLKVFARSFAIATVSSALFMLFAPAEWADAIMSRVYALVTG